MLQDGPRRSYPRDYFERVEAFGRSLAARVVGSLHGSIDHEQDQNRVARCQTFFERSPQEGVHLDASMSGIACRWKGARSPKILVGIQRR